MAATYRKTELEKRLFCDYVYFVRTNAIATPEDIERFKADAERVRRSKEYKQINRI